MLDLIKSIDQDLFLLLNGVHNPLFDSAMYWISSKYIWIPFYLFVLFLIQRKEGWKNFGLAIFAITIMITITDQGSGLVKETIQRYRPSHNLSIKELVHTVQNYYGGQYGFFSSHAANTFGIAIFCGNVLSNNNRKAYYLFVIWAAVVSYSRIYLGVHYPLDILTGAGFGSLIGWVTFKTYSIKRIKL